MRAFGNFFGIRSIDLPNIIHTASGGHELLETPIVVQMLLDSKSSLVTGDQIRMGPGGQGLAFLCSPGVPRPHLLS